MLAALRRRSKAARGRDRDERRWLRLGDERRQLLVVALPPPPAAPVNTALPTLSGTAQVECDPHHVQRQLVELTHGLRTPVETL